MRIGLLFLILLIGSTMFGQSKALLKEKDDVEIFLYSNLDEFLQNPVESNLHILNSIEARLWRRPKNSKEQLAFTILLCNRGFYENKFYQKTNAVDSYEKAWELYNRNNLNGYDIIEFCLKPLGNLYTELGDYKNAENTIKAYLYLAEKNASITQKTAALINLSVVYQNSGRFKEAIRILSRLIEEKDIEGGQRAKALANIITNFISLKKYSEASQYLNDLKLLINENKINDVQLEINIEKLSSLVALNSGNYLNAESHLKKIERLIVSSPDINHRDLARLYIEHASILTEQNRFNEAVGILSKAIHILIPGYPEKKLSKTDLYPETMLIDIFDSMAANYALKNDYKKALEYYNLSFKVEDKLSELYQYEETKLIQLNDIRTRSEMCIKMYFYLLEQTGNEKYVHEAFLLAEKTRATILKETLLEKQQQAGLKVEPLLKKQIELERQNIRIKNLLVKEQLKDSEADITYINQLINTQNTLNLELKKVSGQLKKKYPDLYRTTKELDISALMKQLNRDDATMIEYFHGKDALYYFMLSDYEIKMLRIEDIETVNASILNFISYFDNASKINNDVTGYNNAAFSLYQLLNISSVGKTKNLIIIPDGILNFVPFETLLTQKTGQFNFEKLPYLLHKYGMVYNASAEFYLNNISNKQKKMNVLGVFPVFEGTEQPLSYSIDEANAIKALFPGLYLMRKDASFKNFTENISSYGILHLSTHADAGTYTTPASIHFADEQINLYDLYLLPLEQQLVILSACETGIGKLQKGEGVLSVARGFQYSGANNLLFSLWKVNDLSTSQLMGMFYKNYEKSSSAYLSNHQAKLQYLSTNNIENSKKSPYYWGSFVFYGTLESPTENYTFYITIIVILAVIILFLIIKFKDAKPEKIPA